MDTAKPKAKAQAPAPRAPRGNAASDRGARAPITKEQDAFASEAAEFAAALGWEGEGNWVLNGIQVKDARVYLTRIFHQVHVAVAVPDQAAPTAPEVCEHLGITDPEAIETVKGRLAQLLEREKGTPTTPAN